MSKFLDIFLPQNYETKLKKQELFLAPYMIISAFVLALAFFLLGVLNIINKSNFLKTMGYWGPALLLLSTVYFLKKNKVLLSAYLMTASFLIADLLIYFLLSNQEPPEVILFRFLAFCLATLIFNESAALHRGQGIMLYAGQVILMIMESIYCFTHYPQKFYSVALVTAICLIAIIFSHTILLLLNKMKRYTSNLAYEEAARSKKSLGLVNSVLAEVQDSLEIGKRLETQTNNAENEVSKLEEMYTYLTNGADNLTQSSHTILNASDNVKNQADSMKESVQEQNAAITETSAALTQISANLTNINKIASARRESMSQIVESMEKQNALLKEITEEVNQVQTSTSKINEFVNTVNGIADQTSLLSMNASIEAAHSGEHGKGFSVIAQEIRKLSNETSKNATAIEEALSKNNELVRKTVERIKEFAEFTASSSSEIKNTALSIEEILRGITEMDSGTHEVMKAMENIVEECNTTGDLVSNVTKNVAEQRQSIYNVNNFSTNLAEQVQSIDSLVKNIRSVLSAIKVESDNTAAASKKISDVVNAKDL